MVSPKFQVATRPELGRILTQTERPREVRENELSGCDRAVSAVGG